MLGDSATPAELTLPTHLGDGAPCPGEPLLDLSSDDNLPAPPGEHEPVLSAEEADRRKRRRERWEREAEARQRWELQRRLADIATDVEFLAREVERVRAELEVPMPSLEELPAAERVQLEGARRKRCNDLLNNHCKKALAHITTHKWSWPFNAPVDLRQYPDYADMVAHPMDFGTVKRRIDAAFYRHPDEFLADVRLVFDNARLYNKPGSDVHVMANTLQERFEERYAVSVTPRVLEEAAIAAHQLEEARRRCVEAGTRDGGDALEQHCAVLVKYIDEVQACILDARSAAAALCKPVSREDKEALVRALSSMPQEQFEVAVGLVMGHHPGLQPYDDFGFDLDALDALALRQMQSFVRACEAVEAEARRTGRQPARVAWPQLLAGAGLRGYRPSAKRQKQQAGGSAQASPQQPAAQVKQEPGQQQQQQQQQPRSPPAPQQQQQQQHKVTDEGPPNSTLTAAAAAAAGLVSPVPPHMAGAGEVPPAGSAIGPKPLTAVPEAGQPQQQQQKRPVTGTSKQAAPPPSPAVASSAPVAPLAPAGAPKQAGKPGGGTPTPAQLAAVAKADPQQQQLLAQMHTLLSQVQKTQAAATQAAAGQQAQQAKHGTRK